MRLSLPYDFAISQNSKNIDFAMIDFCENSI